MARRGDTSLPREQYEITGAGASGGASSSTGPAMDDDVALDIDELLRKVEQQYQLLQMETTPAQDRFLTISRVRELTRNVRQNEYTPHYVPIGPYHWSSSSQQMKDQKFKYLAIALDAFAKNTGKNDKKSLLGELLQEMKTLGASSCYSDRFDGMGAEKDFLHMLLLDGCYLLVLFADSLYREPSPSALEAQAQAQAATLQQGATGAAEVRQATRSLMASNNEGDGPPTSGVPEARTGSASASGDVAARNNDAKVRDTWYLLENQIPFFVVQKIYELVKKDTSSVSAPNLCNENEQAKQSAVLTMFTEYIRTPLQVQRYISETAEWPPTSDLQDPSHLLHLVHTYFTRTKNSPAAQAEGGASDSSGTGPAAQAEGGASDSSGTGPWRRATEYCSYANVRFHPRKFDSGEASSVLDVDLGVSLDVSGALLVLIPLLRVDNNTWTILRNLMALEDHHAVSLPRKVTAYCLFMSQLACTEEDVALLRRRRVVEHFLGSDAEAAAGFADLCKGVVLNVDDVNSNYLKPVWHELERRYRSRWHNLVAWFRQTHCRNPLYVAAFVIAVIVFGLQVLQAFYPIFGQK